MLLSATQPIERSGLEAVLNKMPSGVLRIKGFVRLAEAYEKTMLLQAVGHCGIWHDAPQATETSKLVLIGLTATLDTGTLTKRFAPLGLEPDAAGSLNC